MASLHSYIEYFTNLPKVRIRFTTGNGQTAQQKGEVSISSWLSSSCRGGHSP